MNKDLYEMISELKGKLSDFKINVTEIETLSNSIQIALGKLIQIEDNNELQKIVSILGEVKDKIGHLQSLANESNSIGNAIEDYIPLECRNAVKELLKKYKFNPD